MNKAFKITGIAIGAAAVITSGYVAVSYATAPHISQDQISYATDILTDATGWQVTETTVHECNIVERIKTGDWVAYPGGGGCRYDYSDAVITFKPTGSETAHDDIAHLIDSLSESDAVSLGTATPGYEPNSWQAEGTFPLKGETNPVKFFCLSGSDAQQGSYLFCSLTAR